MSDDAPAATPEDPALKPDQASDAAPDQAALVQSGVSRLTAMEEMGSLVKVLAIMPPDTDPPPAFEDVIA